MPSPFPGMDPYLEDPAHWRGVHERLILGICEDLNRTLPDGFVADVDERVYVVPPERSVYTGVAVLQRPSECRRLPAGGTAVLDAPSAADVPYILSVRDEPVYEAFVEIRAVGGAEDLVAVIEVRSPTKRRRAVSAGRNISENSGRYSSATPICWRSICCAP